MQSAEGRAEARAPNRQGLDRASPAALALLALALAALLAGCGGGGDGDDEAPPPWSGVTITAPTESDAYATEATALMLGGISFVPATFSCSLIGGSLPEGYLVSWRNAANGATGGGRASIA
ncbi:hypothetical protein [uncultured Piscinibacter sp.]|uniref:hypothetical protein n=1 Tax=uncultured Piscinibacter sp. TaxID=1131835 RepID=UPI002634D95A|nr:hypothetical protein [uncultured Piscinibacter sp.]